MKKLIYSFFSLITIGLITASFIHSTDTDDEAMIRELVQTSYVNGAFNDLNPDAMESAFHPDFAIFSAKGEELARYEIADWVKSVRKTKESPDFDASKNKWEHDIETIDVTGSAASLKLKYFREGNLVYTDYISLLKFERGWKIVAKVYEHHGKKK